MFVSVPVNIFCVLISVSNVLSEIQEYNFKVMDKTVQSQSTHIVEEFVGTRAQFSKVWCASLCGKSSNCQGFEICNDKENLCRIWNGPSEYAPSTEPSLNVCDHFRKVTFDITEQYMEQLSDATDATPSMDMATFEQNSTLFNYETLSTNSNISTMSEEASTSTMQSSTTSSGGQILHQSTTTNLTPLHLSTVQSWQDSTESDCGDCECWSLRGMVGKLTILLAGQFIEVNCTEDGTLFHWTTFQRRIDGSVDFYRNWTDYENGFGSTDGEFWLGNKYIHELTKLGHTYLRIDLLTFDGKLLSIEYATFRVGDSSTKYILEVGNPVYSSTPEWDIGDSMADHNGMRFTTYDSDNDDNKSGNIGNCAIELKGGWWYRNCGDCNLNGEYSHERYPPDDRVYWKDYGGFQESLKEVTMKIRKP